MNNLEKIINNFTYKTIWSEEDQEYIGICEEFPSLSFLDPEQTEAFIGVIDLVKTVIEDMAQNNELLNFLFEKELQNKINKVKTTEEKLKETKFCDIPNELNWIKPILEYDEIPPVLRPSHPKIRRGIKKK